MKISIKNFNNISELDYSIQDHKINYLFGISGTGKSSIAKSLAKEPEDFNALVGHELSEIVTKIDDGAVDHSVIKAFDSSYMDGILISREDQSDVYSIIMGDGGKIEECKSTYLESIKALNPIKDELYIKKGKLEELIESLKIAYDKKGNLKASSKLQKSITNVSQIKGFNTLKSYSSKEIAWFATGMSSSSYNSGKCPFCYRKLTEHKKSVLSNLSNFDVKDFELINQKTGLFDEFGITIPDFKRKKDTEAFLKRIKELHDVLPEIEDISNYITIVQNTEFDPSELKVFNPSRLLLKVFPDFVDPLKELKTNIVQIRKSLSKLKSETDKVIRGNCDEINGALSLLGIPYEFQKGAVDDSNRTATFKIRHNLDKEGLDRTEGLSTGEKNIIGLLFFLIANKDSQIEIIDDPASSFDEYRRKIIFDLIYQYHKDSTVLVLSHDHVFAKFASFYKEYALKSTRLLPKTYTKYANETGNIDFIESYDRFEIKPIVADDFKSIEECAKEVVSKVTKIDYRTALNLRLLYELKKETSDSNKMVYEYLSAIIHKARKEDITIALSTKYHKKTEYDVLGKIKDDLELAGPLDPLDTDYISKIDLNSLTLFEMVLCKREEVNKKTSKGKAIFDELSNIIHLNVAYAICLNPYKFNYFSKFVYSYIT